MKHTPGPWELRKLTHSKPPWIEIGASDGVVADVQRWIGGRPGTAEENEANARLIAAAPELYEALKAAQEELRLLRMKDTAVVYDPMLAHKMSLAIAKAEGVAPENGAATAGETSRDATKKG